MAALGGEGVPATLKGRRDRLVHIWLRRRAQHLPAHQQEKVPLAHGQSGQIRLLQLQGGDDGVVVGHLPIVHQQGHILDVLQNEFPITLTLPHPVPSHPVRTPGGFGGG